MPQLPLPAQRVHVGLAAVLCTAAIAPGAAAGGVRLPRSGAALSASANASSTTTFASSSARPTATANATSSSTTTDGVDLFFGSTLDQHPAVIHLLMECLVLPSPNRYRDLMRLRAAMLASASTLFPEELVVTTYGAVQLSGQRVPAHGFPLAMNEAAARAEQRGGAAPVWSDVAPSGASYFDAYLLAPSPADAEALYRDLTVVSPEEASMRSFTPLRVLAVSRPATPPASPAPEELTSRPWFWGLMACVAVVALCSAAAGAAYMLRPLLRRRARGRGGRCSLGEELYAMNLVSVSV